MTGDGRTDVVMGYHIWNGVTNMNQSSVFTDSGFIKKGLGTFSVASMANKVSGVVAVSNGTLRVDGMLVTPSSVEVAAGAYLGGTGTVARVAMEAGAGFDAPAGQDKPLTVQGDLALPATGVVNISNLDGSEEKDMKPVNLVTATGDISGVGNLAGWTVKVNGVTTRKWRLAVKNGVLGAKFNNGFVITFK
jgi:autotransporter-associated beta strand protein